MSPNVNASLPLDKAELIAFFLESLFFGVAVLLFGITVWVLVYRRKTEHLNKRLLITSSLLMFFSGLHMAVDLARLLEGFIYRRNHVGGPIAYFGRLFEWTFILKTSIFVVQTVLADAFATYRCYVVWNRWWSVAAPGLSVLATLCTGIGVVYNCVILHEGEDVFSSALIGWVTAFFTLTLVTNLTCTSLISSRIWLTTKKVARFSGQQTLLPVVIVIVESGAIYSISCIAILITYLLNSNAQYLAIDCMFPVISIVFNLIIVRIALGISHGGAGGPTTQNPSTSIVDPSRLNNQHQSQLYQQQYSMKPLAVTVTQLVEQDSDDATTTTTTPVKDDGSLGLSAKERASWNAV